MQRVCKMAGDSLAFGEVNLHLHHLALGHGLTDQIFAAAGVPLYGVAVGIVGGLPVAILFELLALLVGFLALLHVLLAGRRREVRFGSCGDILRRGRFSLLRAGCGGGMGGGWRARLERREREGMK